MEKLSGRDVQVEEADVVKYHTHTTICDGINPVDVSNSYDCDGGSWLLGAPNEHIQKIVLDTLPALKAGGLVCFTERAESGGIQHAHELMLLLARQAVLSHVRTHTEGTVTVISATTTLPVTIELLSSLNLPSLTHTFAITIKGHEYTFQLLSQ